MGRKVVVKGDAVSGTDRHHVVGTISVPGPPPITLAYPPPGSPATAQFTYTGAMTDALSDLVTIGGRPVAAVTSHSSLNAGEAASGGHSGPQAQQPFAPIPTGTPILSSFKIIDVVGSGTPGATAGSGFVTIGGAAVLLDGDAVDTCDGTGAQGNSHVSSSHQGFVEVSE
jgi:hypothetical protein